MKWNEIIIILLYYSHSIYNLVILFIILIVLIKIYIYTYLIIN